MDEKMNISKTDLNKIFKCPICGKREPKLLTLKPDCFINKWVQYECCGGAARPGRDFEEALINWNLACLDIRKIITEKFIAGADRSEFFDAWAKPEKYQRKYWGDQYVETVSGVFYSIDEISEEETILITGRQVEINLESFEKKVEEAQKELMIGMKMLLADAESKCRQEFEIKAVETVKSILKRGNDVEIRSKKDGIQIIEVQRKTKYST